MYKTRAVIFTTIIALVGLFVIMTVTTVFDDDSASRYGDIGTPTTTAENKPTPVESEVVEPSTPLTPVEDVIEPEPVPEPAPLVVTEPEPTPVPLDVVDPVTPVVEDDTPVDVVDPAVPATDTPPASEGGAVHVVTAQGLKYEPMVTVIQPGDIVAWENMSSHDTQSMEGLIPEGAEHWHSAMGENYQRTFTVEGIYIYKCTPHFGAGMGGAIIVGQPTNLEVIKNSDAKGAAKRLVKKALAAAADM